MVKLKIFKGEKDESEKVFVQEEGQEPKLLTFDAIKGYSMALLAAATKGEDCSYEVDSGDLPFYYKDMIEKTFNSVINDNELKELYLEVNPKPENNE